MCLFFNVTEKEKTAIRTNHEQRAPSPSEMKALIEQSLDADKALDIVTVNLEDAGSAMADYMIIASGTSSRHVSSIATKLKDKLSMLGIKGVRVEGLAQADWVVLDAGDVIVHLFRPEVRAFYNLEKMWCAHQPFDIVDSRAQA